MYAPADGGAPTHRAPSIAAEGELHPWLKHRLTLGNVAPEGADTAQALSLSRSQYYAVISVTGVALGRLTEWL
eukprot:SAG11_NODE_8401_length_1020_cov_1.027144_1_plen_72_part_01